MGIGSILAILSVALWTLGGIFGASTVDYYIKPSDCSSKSALGNTQLRNYITEKTVKTYPMFTQDHKEIGTLQIGESERTYYFYFKANKYFEEVYKDPLSWLHLSYSPTNLENIKDVTYLKKFDDMDVPELCMVKTKKEFYIDINEENANFYLTTKIAGSSKNEEKLIIFASSAYKP